MSLRPLRVECLVPLEVRWKRATLMPATGRLTGEITGEVETEDGVLVIRRVHVEMRFTDKSLG